MTPFCPADIFPRDGEEAGAVKGNNNRI